MVDASADVAVEVAIGTLGLAERPVDVEGETWIGQGLCVEARWWRGSTGAAGPGIM
jgi:hypothetical protein